MSDVSEFSPVSFFKVDVGNDQQMQMYESSRIIIA
jgi:hypothetical protein